jgi:hypothetical protein
MPRDLKVGKSVWTTGSGARIISQRMNTKGGRHCLEIYSQARPLDLDPLEPIISLPRSFPVFWD